MEDPHVSWEQKGRTTGMRANMAILLKLQRLQIQFNDFYRDYKSSCVTVHLQHFITYS